MPSKLWVKWVSISSSSSDIDPSVSCTLCSIFVCLDLYYQLNFGQDIFGHKPVGARLSGPFGNELIAGGDELIKTTLKVANGRLTCAEALGHREFVMTKLYRSA